MVSGCDAAARARRHQLRLFTLRAEEVADGASPKQPALAVFADSGSAWEMVESASVAASLRQMSPEHHRAVESLRESIDHVRGPATGRAILVYGDYECPYTRAAYRSISRVEARLGGDIRFAFRHFPLTEIHPHALAAARAAEAAALQGRFWEMHDLLFSHQDALEDEDLRAYAAELGLDAARFESDRRGDAVLERVERDVRSGAASGEVFGTPTLFIDGAIHRGDYNVDSLLEIIAG